MTYAHGHLEGLEASRELEPYHYARRPSASAEFREGQECRDDSFGRRSRWC
jgi:hypothetical protein